MSAHKTPLAAPTASGLSGRIIAAGVLIVALIGAGMAFVVWDQKQQIEKIEVKKENTDKQIQKLQLQMQLETDPKKLAALDEELTLLNGRKNKDHATELGPQSDLHLGKSELEPEHSGAPGPAVAVPPETTNELEAVRRAETALWDSVDGGTSTDAIPTGAAPLSLPELAGISADQLRAKYDIPVELNKAVVAYIRFFQADARESFALWLARSTRWTSVMRPILEKESVPFDLVYLSMVASGFNPFAYSDAKAAGLWQFVVGTSRRYGLTTDFWVDERRDPILSTEAAGRYLSDLKDRFHGDWYLAWAAYNTGEEKVDEAIRLESTVDFWRMMNKGHTLPAETKHFVPKVIAAAIIAKHPEHFGFHVDYEPFFEFDEVHIPQAISLEALARAAGTTVEMIRELNPALRRFCTPPTGWDMRIPFGTKAHFTAAFEKLGPADRLSFAQHKIERGESLSNIAKAYGVSEQAVLRTNGLTSHKQLYVGQTVRIPIQSTHGLLAGDQLDDGGVKLQDRPVLDAGEPASTANAELSEPRPTSNPSPRQLTGRLAVLDLRNFARELSAQNARYFTDVVRQETLRKEPRIEVMTRENLLVLLHASGKDLADCEGECEVDTGRRIGADLIVSGEIQKVGTHLKISLRLHETKEGRLLGSSIASGRSIDELDENAAEAADELYATAVELVTALPSMRK